MNHHHNTTNLDGYELESRETKAQGQDEAILRLFQRFPSIDFTPYEVMTQINLNCPITSIRRSISNLTKAGELTKTQKKRMGNYGMSTYCWRLKFRDKLEF